MHADAFAEAFPLLSGRAYALAYRLIGSRCEAEEVAQEAMVRAYLKWGDLKPGCPEAWVCTVVTHLVVDRGRWLARRRRMWLPREFSPDTEAYAIQRLELRTALASLSRRQQEVAVLRWFEGISDEDAALTLGMSVGAVKQHAARACRRLRHVLRPVDDKGDDARVRAS